MTTVTETTPDTPIAAFFDLDETLIAANSARLWITHMWRQGKLGLRDTVRSLGWLLRYRFAMIDMADISRKALAGLEGQVEDELRADVLAWYEQQIKDLFYDDAIALIERHREQGHHLILLTAASPYIAEPVCRDLQLHDLLCTRLEVRPDGRFSGRPVEPLCYGEGKVHWAERLAQERGVDLDRSYFYTDSYTDLPMLRRVGHPVATNPDPRLRRLALQEGMAVRDFVQ